jgi:hypothetical protein
MEMRRHLIYFIILASFLLPASILGAEVYKWVDEKGTINLTDDPKQIPEKFSDRVETIVVPDRYAEPIPPAAEVVVPSRPQAEKPFLPEPEKPKVTDGSPPSGFIPFNKFKYLTEGMTEPEVLSRFGPPTREVADEVEVTGYFGRGGLSKREALVKRYYYIGDPDLGERTTIIHFKNGIVQKIERIFPPTW